VKSAGVVVGRIANISFDDKTYQATVTMTIEDAYKFPKDSSAKILTSGLLGEQYIGLEAGGADDMLAAGDKIIQTQSAVVLENLISQFLYNKAADSGQDKGATK
jgi:phospholipid/cholesterol/gamma-HCH transport system substrate-binding protein